MERASFPLNVVAADFMASMFWLRLKTARWVDAALVSPKQKGSCADAGRIFQL